MTETVFYVRYGMPGQEHIYRTRMPETVGRIEVFQPFWWQDFFQILSTEPIYSMPGKFLSPLIEEQTIPVESVWCNPVFFNIPAKKICRLGPEAYHSETPSLTENDQRFFLWVKEVEIKCSNFAGPGTRIEKQIYHGIISEALC